MGHGIGVTCKKCGYEFDASVEGYTAEKLASMSPYLDGEGAFMLLIELKENPDKAKKRIAEGFKMK